MITIALMKQLNEIWMIQVFIGEERREVIG